MPHDLTDLLPRVRAFVRDEVRPLEAHLLAHDYDALESGVDAARAKAKEAGLWNPQLAEDAGGLGLSLPEFGRVSEALGTSPLGHVVCNAQAPDAGNMEILLEHATPRSARPLPRPAPPRRRAELLRDDRARARRLEPRDPLDHGPPRRRRLRPRRAQVVHDGGRRRGVRDRDGGDESRRREPLPPRQPTHRADRHAGLRARPPHSGDGRRGAGVVLPLRSPLHRSAVCPSRTGSATRGRASSSRRSGSGRAASTTACAGSACASGRSTCCVERAAERGTSAGQTARDAAGRAVLDRREPCGDRRRPPPRARRRRADRARRCPRGPRRDLRHQVPRRRAC